MKLTAKLFPYTMLFRFRHQRGGRPRAGIRVDRVGHRLQFVVVGEVGAHGILPGYEIGMLRKRGIFTVEVHRQRNARVRDRSESAHRSEEHTSELQSLMRIAYAVFCLKKKKTHTKYNKI